MFSLGSTCSRIIARWRWVRRNALTGLEAPCPAVLILSSTQALASAVASTVGRSRVRPLVALDQTAEKREPPAGWFVVVTECVGRVAAVVKVWARRAARENKRIPAGNNQETSMRNKLLASSAILLAGLAYASAQKMPGWRKRLGSPPAWRDAESAGAVTAAAQSEPGSTEANAVKARRKRASRPNHSAVRLSVIKLLDRASVAKARRIRASRAQPQPRPEPARSGPGQREEGAQGKGKQKKPKSQRDQTTGQRDTQGKGKQAQPQSRRADKGQEQATGATKASNRASPSSRRNRNPNKARQSKTRPQVKAHSAMVARQPSSPTARGRTSRARPASASTPSNGRGSGRLCSRKATCHA